MALLDAGTADAADGFPEGDDSVDFDQAPDAGDYDGSAYDDTGPFEQTWVKLAPGNESSYSRSVAALPDGSACVAGNFTGIRIFGTGEPNETTLTSPYYRDVFLARYRPDGTLAWVRQGIGAGDDGARGVATLWDGSCVIAGTFQHSVTFDTGGPNETSLEADRFGMDIFLARFLADGSLAWVRRAGGPVLDAGFAVGTAYDNSILITGFFGYEDGSDHENTATFGPGEPNETVLTEHGRGDIYIAKYRPDGYLVWAKQAGGLGHQWGYALSVGSDGSIAITGYFDGVATFGPGEANQTQLDSESNENAFVARYSRDGDLTWVRRVTGTESSGTGVALQTDGSVLVTGLFRDQATFGPGEANEVSLSSLEWEDVFLAKYNPGGDLAWVSHSGGEDSQEPFGLAATDESSTVVGQFCGQTFFGIGDANESTRSPQGGCDGFILHCDRHGSPEWIRTVGSSRGVMASGAAVAPNRHMLVTGSFQGVGTFELEDDVEVTLAPDGEYAIYVMMLGL